MFLNVYKGKKVLVTGHTGFKGSWLVTWLHLLGAKVVGVSDGVPTIPSNFEESSLGDGDKIKNHFLDIRDRSKLQKVFDEEQPEFVFHLAAQALVRKSYSQPVETFETNVIGTLNVLEAVRHTSSIRSLVLITSDKAYKNVEWVWGYRETDALGGDDPYSASKGCAEIVAHSYFKSFFTEISHLAYATARAGNVIGGGDWAADRIIPDCVRAWSADKTVQIRSPKATRPWQLVLEPLSGYLWLGAILYKEAENKTQNPFSCCGESFNFGPSSDAVHTVEDVVTSLGRYWDGFSSVIVKNNKPSMSECTLLKLSCDKALAYLKWRATLNFDETIRLTAEWYRDFYKKRDRADSLTEKQIQFYCDKARERGGAVWAI